MLSVFYYSGYVLCVYIYMYMYMPRDLVYHVLATTTKKYWRLYVNHTQHVQLPTQFHYVELSSTVQNSKALQLLDWCPSHTSRYLVCDLLRDFMQLLHNFHSPAYWEFTSTCGLPCNIARFLAHVKSQLIGPTRPLQGHNPSILRGTSNDMGIPSDVKLSLFCTLHYP